MRQRIAALESSRDELMRTEEALREEKRLLTELLDVQQRERTLVACEIHDGLAQKLVAALMQLRASSKQWENPSKQDSKSFATAIQLLRDSLNEARSLISGLEPPLLKELGIAAAILCLVRAVEEREESEIEFVYSIQSKRFAPTLETALFRIVQEALTNACRHSRSKRVLANLTEQNGHVRAEIQDWGIGFEPDCVEVYRFGLRGIRERAKLLGGRATIDSAPGKGTRIAVELPVTSMCGSSSWIVKDRAG